MRKVMVAVGFVVLAVATFAWAKTPPAGTGWYPQTGYITGNGDLAIDPSADTSTWEYAWQPTVAATTFPAAQVLANARSVCFDNRTTGSCYWEPGNSNIDPTTLTTNGSMGERFQVGDYRCFDIKSSRFLAGSGVACTAAASSTSPLMTRQWR